MDLATVLADGTDGLGHFALARYFRDIFASFSQDYPCAFRVRAAVNIGVQQLATASRVDPAGECFLQVGGFSPDDLPAALVNAMPHTRAHWQQGSSSLAVTDIEDALATLRARLPADAMPMRVRLADPELPIGCFGLIVVFEQGAASDLTPWLTLLNRRGRLLSIHRDSLAQAPRLGLHQREHVS